MKNIKNIVVKLTPDNISQHVIDNDIFDDVYMEAATRAVESLRKKKSGLIRPIIECWNKQNSKKVILYNSYYVMVNAALYQKAELLRKKFKMQTDCDLANEPMHSSESKYVKK